MDPAGFFHLAGFLDEHQQRRLIEWTRELCKAAPLVQPKMPNGTPMSVQVTNAGRAGWWSDQAGGYRYIKRHPTTNEPWPDAPPWILAFANKALLQAGLGPAAFDCIAVNYYAPEAKLGMHIDRSEVDQSIPIVSFSLGSEATFVMGGPDRDGPTQRYHLASGDCCVMAPPARNWFHSVARVHPRTIFSPTREGRINLTIRKVL